MNDDDSLLWVSKNHTDAEKAIRALHQSGVDIKTLSLLGKGYQSVEEPLGFYNVGQKMKAWGGMGAFWGGLWGLLAAPAVFVIPGIGVVALAGPLVAALFGALEGAVAIGGFGALAAALSSIGIPKDQVLSYSTTLRAESYALFMHGDATQVSMAKAVLEASCTPGALANDTARLPQAALASGHPNPA